MKVTLIFLVFCVTLYLMYMIGLILVLRRMRKLNWMAFVPLLNYYALMRAVNAPGRWFFLTWVPYLGAAYAGTILIRTGAVFGRGPAFSLFWLTLGSPVGMFRLAFTKKPLDRELLSSRPKLLDIKAMKGRRPAKS
jgi:hypothetical protein